MFFEDELDAAEDTESEKLPREYGIDFDTGQLTGEIVEGSEAVAVWAWLALKTARYRYSIYSWDYGSEVDTLIGQRWSKEYTESLVKKYLTECLTVNENIEGIKNLVCTHDGDHISASFTIVTSFGEEQINV